MSNEESDERKSDNPWPRRNGGHREKEEDMKLWGILIFGLIGATATTFAVTQLRRTADWVYSQLSRSQSTWRDGRSFRSSFQEEAWKRYNRRMQEEYEEELERVERIRRMQSVFNRERNKFKKSYQNWQENGHDAYHQHSQRNDWYWNTDKSFRDHGSNFRETPRATERAPLSHHYSVLGLDRRRTTPYTDEEIKMLLHISVYGIMPVIHSDLELQPYCRQHSELRQRNFTPIRIRIKKSWLKQNSRKLWCHTRLSRQKERIISNK